MSDLSPLIQSLRDLGLTRTEAEVYLAVLREGADGPVSGYRVAQAMGRDPANLGKTLAALVTRGAVQVVQDKPRLFQPRTPDEFMDNIVSAVRVTSDTVREQLRDLSPATSGAHPLTLQDQDRVFDKTRRLLLSCGSSLHLAASGEVMDALCDQLNRLAAPGTVDLRLHSPVPCAELKPHLEIIPVEQGLSADMPHPWLQFVVDRRAVLMAVFKPDCSLESPCGWWLEDAGFGAVTAAVMCTGSAPVALPFGEDVPEPEPVAAPAGVPEFEAETEVLAAAPAALDPEPEPAAEPVPEPEPEPAPEPSAVERLAPEPEPEPGPPQETGFQFIVRHEDENGEEETK